MVIDYGPVAGPSRHADNGSAFPALPEELIKLILEYACRPSRLQPQLDTGASGTHAQQCDALIDAETARTVATTSQAAYTLVAPILYNHVSLTRPSQLVKFAQTLLQRPELGLLVRSLWIGNVQSPSPAHLLPPFVFRDTSFAMSARAHLQRRRDTQSSSSEQQGFATVNIISAAHQGCPDFIYLERGCDYAAMTVGGPERRIVTPRRAETHSPYPAGDDVFSDESGEEELPFSSYFFDTDLAESASYRDANTTPMRSGLGIDKQWGFDAAGTWVGSDKWLLRSIELQAALEFHFEWVLVTAHLTRSERDAADDAVLRGMDEEMKRGDPLDWQDAITYPDVLPSEEARRERDLSQSSSSTTADKRSNASKFGYRHIDRFFALRRKGYSPRHAAYVLLRRLLDRHGSASDSTDVDAVCNARLLSDGSELDDFLSPALFAQSGATHLLVHTNPPEGEHAPPDAVPAQVFAASHNARPRRRRRRDDGGGNDEQSSSESDTDNRADPQTRRGAVTHNIVDLVDVFGHVDNRARTLQLGFREERPFQDVFADPISDAAAAATAADTLGTTLRPLATNGMSKHAQRGPTTQDGNLSRVTTETPQTLGSLVAKLRAVLAFCPHMRVLGLNGFLERAVAGNRGCPPLTKLRHLSLGPPPPYWSLPLNLDQHVLTSLRSLHVSGCMLYRSEVMAIGGYVPTALPRLRDFSWTLWVEHALDHPITVVGALAGLLGSDSALYSRGHREDGQRRPRSSTSSAHNAMPRVSTPCTRPLRRVRVCLNEMDLQNWRQHAPEALRDDPRLQLMACSPEVGSNFQAVRTWWEHKAGV